MPRGDGTGPMGYGPMTGRGAGYCAGYEVPGYMSQISRAGFENRGCGVGGFGGGRGRRNRFLATGLPGWMRGGRNMSFGGWGLPARSGVQKQELELLQEQAKYFAESLEDINRRIEELGKEKQI